MTRLPGRCAWLLSGILFLAAGWDGRAEGKSITFELSGPVELVIDATSLLGGSVQVGDPVTARYTFESTTADSNADPTVGDFDYTTTQFTIRAEVDGLVFEADPANVSALIEVVDRPTGDSYLVRSRNNLPLSPTLASGPIEWTLRDSSGTALSSAALLLSPPVLGDFPDPSFGFRMTGGPIPFQDEGPTFLIQADITGVKKVVDRVPGPGSLALVLLAAGILHGRRRRSSD